MLDLEDLAAHRGSVLGNLPDRPQPSQKWFESLLLNELAAFDAARTVFVEGESKKIGQLQVPEALIAAMRSSPCVVLDTAPEARVELLLEEYRHFVENPPRSKRSSTAWWPCTAGRGSPRGSRSPRRANGGSS